LIAQLLAPRFAVRIVVTLGLIAQLLAPRFAVRIVVTLGLIAQLLAPRFAVRIVVTPRLAECNELSERRSNTASRRRLTRPPTRS
jgi:hypothetical protein